MSVDKKCLKYIVTFLDIDECKYPAGTFCHINARCDNSPTSFSFSCTCINGYQGNGTFCAPVTASSGSSGRGPQFNFMHY